MDPLRIVRRFQANGLFKSNATALEEASDLREGVKEAMRAPDETVEEKQKGIAAACALLSSKLHRVFVHTRKFDVDFEPNPQEEEGYEALGKKLHSCEAALQRLANFVLHPEKHLDGEDDIHSHIEAAWTLANEAFKEVHAAHVAAEALHKSRTPS